MITNADITLYCNWYNPLIKKTEYVDIQIPNVWFKVAAKTTVSKEGYISANEYKVRIPDSSFRGLKFIDSKQYMMLPKDQLHLYFTVHDGAILVPRLIEDRITSINDLKKKYVNVARIVNHAVNLIGTNPHIRIGGAD